MLFHILHDENSDNLGYLLADADAREAVLVDPRSHDLPVLMALLGERDLRLRWILRTHHHDPAPDMERAALRRLGAPLVQGEWAEDATAIVDGQALTFGSEHVRVMQTPGHTVGCLSFVWRDRVFCGGALAVDSCSRQPRPADPAAQWDSVTRHLFSLADETLLFAAHRGQARLVSTVLEQRRWNPWFAGCTRDQFLARVRALGQPSPQNPTVALPTG